MHWSVTACGDYMRCRTFMVAESLCRHVWCSALLQHHAALHDSVTVCTVMHMEGVHAALHISTMTPCRASMAYTNRHCRSDSRPIEQSK